jgi:hypothetical protein
MVGDIGSEEEEALAEDLRQLRQPDDPFSYELLFVPASLTRSLLSQLTSISRLA